MPERAVLPIPGPAAQPAPVRGGIAPFFYTAQLIEQGGAEVVTQLPVSVWPARNSLNGGRGRHHTHTGEAHPAYAEQLQVPNRSLVIAAGALAGTYKITSAVPQQALPHVQLELTRTTNAQG